MADTKKKRNEGVGDRNSLMRLSPATTMRRALPPAECRKENVACAGLGLRGAYTTDET